MEVLITQIEIRYEQDVVYARRRAHLIAEFLSFDRNDCTRISTAVSEIARNAFIYATRGRVQFFVRGEAPNQVFRIVIKDSGPGIENVDAILSGEYASRTGMGLGMVGSKNLMDDFRVESIPGEGAKVTMDKRIPLEVQPVTPQMLNRLADLLLKKSPESPLEEVRLQNQELMQALEQLQEKQQELIRLNQSLEDKNKGILALYKELEEKATELAEANEFKDSFISQISHEFRTPLSVIVGLTDLLLSGMEGELNPEQETQVRYIQKAAHDLSEMVNDLLDLAKIKAGKSAVYPQECTVSSILSTSRGMLLPLVNTDAVDLIFEEQGDIPPLCTDEGKVQQILRNFLSNAIKFTEKGEIRTVARLSEDGKNVIFSVSDTGIGIAEEDLERIFEEYEQVPGTQKHKFKSTGLGLPIAKRLAELLGGRVYVESTPNEGSTFYVEIPIRYTVPEGEVNEDKKKGQEAPVVAAVETPPQETPEPAPIEVAEEDKVASFKEQLGLDVLLYPVLLITDDPATCKLYEDLLVSTRFQVLACNSLQLSKEKIYQINPLAVVIDVLLLGEDTVSLIQALKKDENTKTIPLLVVSVPQEEGKARSLGVDEYTFKPIKRQWLLDRLTTLAEQQPVKKILVIDDQEMARYVLRTLLADTKYQVIEASNGKQGLELAEKEHPDAIYLDLMLPDMNGMEVLEKLKDNPGTQDIPVVINTGKELDEEERQRLNRQASTVLTKGGVSPDAAVDMIREALRQAIKRTS